MPDNITPLDLAQRPAEGIRCGACGGSGEEPHEFHIGSEDCDVCQRNIVNCCPTCNGEGVERYPQDAGFPHPRSIAAPHCADAILWLLGTAAWRAKFGAECYFKAKQGYASVWDEHDGGYDELVFDADTAADLLKAMMEALA